MECEPRECYIVISYCFILFQNAIPGTLSLITREDNRNVGHMTRVRLIVLIALVDELVPICGRGN